MYHCHNIGTSSLTDDPGREELLDSFPLFLPALTCTGDATALRLPDGGLLAERGWDEVGGREPRNKQHPFTFHRSLLTLIHNCRIGNHRTNLGLKA